MGRAHAFVAATVTALVLWLGTHGAQAQKSGGILKMPDFASPASMSIHEEVTRAAVTVLMPVFNNLVLFDQHKERNTIGTIVPDLAESWAWSEDGKQLTFKLRHGVKWHDGKPFTAADVNLHLGPLAGEDAGEITPQSAQSVISQPRRGHAKRRGRSHLSPEAAAALSFGAARLRRLTGLSLPRFAGADATAPDRRRPVQIRRI